MTESPIAPPLVALRPTEKGAGTNSTGIVFDQPRRVRERSAYKSLPVNIYLTLPPGIGTYTSGLRFLLPPLPHEEQRVGDGYAVG